jgi:hypothetical protein
MKYVLCGPHTSAPTQAAECREAIWSEGQACRKCDNEGCFQRGMTKAEATLENARRVNPPFKCPCCERQTRLMLERSTDDYIGHTCGCRMMPQAGAKEVAWRRTKQKMLVA